MEKINTIGQDIAEQVFQYGSGGVQISNRRTRYAI